MSDRTKAILHRATMRPFGISPIHYSPDDDQGGGGDDDKKDDKKTDDKKSDTKDDKADAKLTLTQDELDAKIADALAAQKRKDEAAAQKKREEGEREAAKAKGEHEKVAQQEKARADAAEAKAKALELQQALRDHLDDKEPTLAKASGVIFKLIDSGEEDQAKAIKAAVELYKKSLPETVKPGGAPANTRTGNRTSGNSGENSPAKHELPNGNRIFSPASRF